MKTNTGTYLNNWINKHYKHELEFFYEFEILGIEDWTCHNDEGLTWAIAESFNEGLQLLIFLYVPYTDRDWYCSSVSYGIHLAEACVPIDELFETDCMNELYSVIMSNINYFNELLNNKK